MKLKNKSSLETLEIVNWLIENVGEKRQEQNSIGLQGYGWSVYWNEFSQSYDIHLDDANVDEETKLLFMLTCA